MYDFGQIIVKHGSSIELTVENQSPYPMIDKGAHGAVFKISEEKCVKIYADKINCLLESQAYGMTQNSTIVPRLYEVGENFIVMEYIHGQPLDVYLKMRNKVPRVIAEQIVFVIREMERLGCTRRDSALRHMLVDKNERIKVIDIVYAYTRNDSQPVKLFSELRELGLLHRFMKKVSQIDPALYRKWALEMKEYLEN